MIPHYYEPSHLQKRGTSKACCDGPEADHRPAVNGTKVRIELKRDVHFLFGESYGKGSILTVTLAVDNHGLQEVRAPRWFRNERGNLEEERGEYVNVQTVGYTIQSRKDPMFATGIPLKWGEGDRTMTTDGAKHMNIREDAFDGACPYCGSYDLQQWADDGEAPDADYWECKCGAEGAIVRADDETRTVNGIEIGASKVEGAVEPMTVGVQFYADTVKAGWIVDVHGGPLDDTSGRFFDVEAQAREFAGHLADLLIAGDPVDEEPDGDLTIEEFRATHPDWKETK